MVQLQRFKKIATFGGTFAFALLIGYVMQYGDADASRFSYDEDLSSRPTLPAQLDVSPLQRTSVLEPKVLAPVQLSANLSESIRFDAGSVKLTALVGNLEDTSLSPRSIFTGLNRHDDNPLCPIELSTEVSEEATVELVVSSHCRADMAFEVQHGELVVSGLTDATGRAAIAIPALEVNGSFLVTFEDGRHSSTSVVVPDAEQFQRVVLQWRGHPAKYIRVSEEAGDLVGSLLRLGEDTGTSKRFAEVYTLPASAHLPSALQSLSVQAEVTQRSCDTPFVASRLIVQPGQETSEKDIRITLPACEHAGTYLELKKVLGGQTLLP